MKIVRCESCGGFGWFEDEFSGQSEDCDWCGGVGYVYRDDQERDSPIPKGDYEAVAAELERLEVERLRGMGYRGVARKPWQQDIRRGSKLGQNPYAADDENPPT